MPTIRPEYSVLCDEAELKGYWIELIVGDRKGPEGKERRGLQAICVKNPRTKRVVGQATLINEDVEHAAKVIRKKV